jgi:hypothetical protein
MGYKLGEELKGPKFTKLMKYVQRMLERPSLKESYDEVRIHVCERLVTYSLLRSGVADRILQDDIH